MKTDTNDLLYEFLTEEILRTHFVHGCGSFEGLSNACDNFIYLHDLTSIKICEDLSDDFEVSGYIKYNINTGSDLFMELTFNYSDGDLDDIEYEIKEKEQTEVVVSGNEIDKESMHRALEKQREAGLLLLLLDSSRPLTGQLDFIRQVTGRKSALVVINKMDLRASWSADLLPDLFAALPRIRISAETGEGIEELNRKICEMTGFDLLDRSDAVVFTDRQRRILLEAEKAIEEGKSTDAYAALKRCLEG